MKPSRLILTWASVKLRQDFASRYVMCIWFSTNHRAYDWTHFRLGPYKLDLISQWWWCIWGAQHLECCTWRARPKDTSFALDIVHQWMVKVAFWIVLKWYLGTFASRDGVTKSYVDSIISTKMFGLGLTGNIAWQAYKHKWKNVTKLAMPTVDSSRSINRNSKHMQLISQCFNQFHCNLHCYKLAAKSRCLHCICCFLYHWIGALFTNNNIPLCAWLVMQFPAAWLASTKQCIDTTLPCGLGVSPGIGSFTPL